MGGAEVWGWEMWRMIFEGTSNVSVKKDKFVDTGIYKSSCPPLHTHTYKGQRDLVYMPDTSSWCIIWINCHSDSKRKSTYNITFKMQYPHVWHHPENMHRWQNTITGQVLRRSTCTQVNLYTKVWLFAHLDILSRKFLIYCCEIFFYPLYFLNYNIWVLNSLLSSSCRGLWRKQ